MKRTRKVLCLITVLLATSLCAMAAEWEKPVPGDVSPVSGEKYYIYNYSIEKFVGVYGMQTVPSETGTPFLMEKNDNGDWTFYGPDGFLYADLDYVGCNGGEGEAGTMWFIEKQTSGSYYLRPSKSDATYSWSAYPDMWTGVSYTSQTIVPIIKAGEGALDWYFLPETKYADFIGKIALHQVMTELQGYGYDVTSLVAVYNTATDKAAFDAAIASVQADLNELRFENASEERPCDVTQRYMRNADLTENWVSDGHDVPGWTMVPASFCGMGEWDGQGFYSDNKTIGSWSGSAFGDNKVYQELKDLKNGKYRLGNYGLWIRHTGEEGDPIKGAYIYAKVGDKMFKSLLTDTGWWQGLSEVEFECRTGEAEVGIMFEGTNVGQCIILDFKLDYFGEKPAADRLNQLIASAQAMMEDVNVTYTNVLAADIKKANELIAAGDVEAQEALFTTFLADYESALANKDAYVKLADVLAKAEMTLADGGESELMDQLGDYLLENEFDEKIKDRAFDNAQIEDIITFLSDLIDKAANSVLAAGTDVTYLLVNGHFDTNGGWKATLNDFGIDSDKKIMEKWWGDWKAEQVLDNVANGTYRLEVQGFQWCSWDWAQSETDWNNGDGSPTFNVKSKIRLNSDEVTIHNVFACGPTDIKEGYEGANYFVPNDANTALKFFALGLYNNVVETTVTDNTLKIEFDCSQNGFWNCFTNLRLIYVGANIQEAIDNLNNALTKANDYLEQKMEGVVRKAIEEAMADGKVKLENQKAKYDDINGAANALITLFDQAAVSIKEYKRLAITLAQAQETLNNATALQTTAGQQLQTLYNTTKADYDSEYPLLDNAGVAAAIDQIEKLISEAKLGGGVKAGDDLTTLITNASFENTYGNDEAVGGAAHTVPYGWSMLVEGKECHTAQELTDAGINSWTAIEDNQYTTDGAHSYCLLSAPVPDAYLYQTIKGLPAGTYKVTVDMNVTYDGGCSRLTGQRLLVNNVAQYYGKPEYYIASELDKLHPEEVSRSFAGYDEVNSNNTGVSGDMGNMSTLTVEVTIGKDEELTLGVRTDNNKVAMNCNYEENWWDCTGRYKLDNFRLYCVSLDATGISSVNNETSDAFVYNLMGVKVNPTTVRGLYIRNGKKYIGR